jgi:hypothetical protein
VFVGSGKNSVPSAEIQSFGKFRGRGFLGRFQ